LRAVESTALEWLARLGVKVPSFAVAGAEGALWELPVAAGAWVVKPDVAMSGKGLQGLVSVCRTRQAVVEAVDRLPGAAVVAEYVDGDEGYLSFVLDGESHRVVVRAGMEGGVGFDPSTLDEWGLELGQEVRDYEIREFLVRVGVRDGALVPRLVEAIQILWSAFQETEATLIEINPFRWTPTSWAAVGVAVEFDDNATSRAERCRPSLVAPARDAAQRSMTDAEAEIEAISLAHPGRPAVRFIELDGDVASLVIGGGAGLATLDSLTSLGLAPSCYVDGSPGAPPEALQALMRVGLGRPGLRGAVVGAVATSLMDTRELARPVLDAMAELGVDGTQFPIVARIAGPNEELSRELFAAHAPAVHVLDRGSSLDAACHELRGLVGGAGRQKVAR
jgi:succinyl-CoA synthetase beta subunit